MTQTQIDFDLPAQRHSRTSVAAAERHAKHAPSWREKVLAYIAACDVTGATDNEIINGLGYVSARPRRIELAREGKIVAAGERDQCTVWVIA